MKIFVIVPVFNEDKRVVSVVKEILSYSQIDKVIIVNDGSIDKTLKEIKGNFLVNTRVILVSHLINLGKGSAMKTGLSVAKKNKADAVIFIDADRQHNPKYLPSFIEALKNYPVVFGYRELNNDTPWVRKTGNKFAGLIVKIIFKITRKDLLCGFMAFRKDVFNKIKWSSARYGVETEIATKVGKNKIPFSEIKIDTIYIDKYKGVTIFDAFKILFKIPFWYLDK